MAIKLYNPQGQIQKIDISANQEIVFEFNPASETVVEHIDGNLVFFFDDQGQIMLTGFYELNSDDLPVLVVNGEEISALDFLAGFGDESLLPAAGAESSQASNSDSSGISAYGDEAGSIVDGIDGLGTLGRNFWESNEDSGRLADTGVLRTAAYQPPTTVNPKDPDPNPNPPEGNPNPPASGSGPRLIDFTLNGKLMEPWAEQTSSGHEPGNNNDQAVFAMIAPMSTIGPGQGSMSHVGIYTIAFDSMSAEDIVITLSLNAQDAVLGQDFTPGTGLYTAAEIIAHYTDSNGNLNLPSGMKFPVGFDPTVDGYDAASDTNYYVILESGQNVANFEVNITHNHRDNQHEDGQGNTVDPSLNWTITDVAGGGVEFDAKEYSQDLLNRNDEIIDDNQGPVVNINWNEPYNEYAGTSVNYSEGKVSLDLKLEDLYDRSGQPLLLGEEIEVKFEVVGADGKVYAVEGSIIIGLDGSSQTTRLDLPDAIADQPYFYLRVAGSDGAESRFDSSLGLFRNPEYSGSNPLVLEHMSASQIYEGMENDIHAEGSNPHSYGQSINYNLNLSFSGAPVSDDVSFTIKPFLPDNEQAVSGYGSPAAGPEDFNGGTEVSVNLSADFLNYLKTEMGYDTEFAMTILPDADGNPGTVVISYGWPQTTLVFTNDGEGTFKSEDGSLTLGSIDGHLPTAIEDWSAERSEGMQSVVVGGDGLDIGDNYNPDYAHTSVEDNGYPVLNVALGYMAGSEFVTLEAGATVPEGAMVNPETGGNYVLRLNLTDESGEGLTLSPNAQPMVFEIIIRGLGGSDVNGDRADVSLYTQKVIIYPGQSLADVRVTFPDDLLAEGDKRFSIEVNQVQGQSVWVNAKYAGALEYDESGDYGVIIKDKWQGEIGEANLFITQGPEMTAEGKDMVFHLNLLDAENQSMLSLLHPVTLTFLVDNPDNLGLDYFYSDGLYSLNYAEGNYYLEVTLPAGRTGLEVRIPIYGYTDGEIDPGKSIGLTLVDVKNEGDYDLSVMVPSGEGHIRFDGENAPQMSYGVEDADKVYLEDTYGQHIDITDISYESVNYYDYDPASEKYVFDGSDSEHGLHINGIWSDNAITGSDHNDIIVSSGNNDILTGGDGNDVFVFTGNYSSSEQTSTIKDFSMDAGSGNNDLLDFRSLLNDASHDNLGQFLSIEQDGNNAKLTVKTDPGNEHSYTQTIVLENVYENGANEIQIDATNELIKQHIILNS